MYAPEGVQSYWPESVCADADAATATKEKSVEKRMLALKSEVGWWFRVVCVSWGAGEYSGPAFVVFVFGFSNRCFRLFQAVQR